MIELRIERVGPMATIQDAGRQGYLADGISASGPMDRGAFALAASLIGIAGPSGIEVPAAPFEVQLLSGELHVGLAGGSFVGEVSGRPLAYPGAVRLRPGDRLGIRPGPAGNFAYLRFDRRLDIAPVLGSTATNMRVGLGGLDGRALVAGDVLKFSEAGTQVGLGPAHKASEGPIRVLWGLHADLFSADVRQQFLRGRFELTVGMDRMGMRLRDCDGVFAAGVALSLVSDPVVPGDIQVLGDGTPIVLMRDHQPTGGYPRIATVLGEDLDRLAQMRPGTPIRFESVSLSRAHGLRGTGR
jgi:allophanate hydrolase